MLLDAVHKILLTNYTDHAGPNFAMSREKPLNRDLADLSALGSSEHPQLAALVHVPRPATDESLIDLDFSTELPARLPLQRQPDSLKHEPSRLLADSRSPADFVGTDTVLAVRQHPHCKQPLVQSDWRILKDSPDLDGELRLRMPSLALPNSPRRYECDILRPTGRAHNAIRPAPRHEIVQAVVGIRKVEDRFLKGSGFARHESSMGQNA